MPDIPYISGPRPEIQATGGGQGSFSYADTSMYGVRQPRQQFVAIRRTYDGNTGLISSEVLVPSGIFVVPGTGGGTKLPGKRLYGSRATGFSPKGAVLLRLTKID